MTQERITIAQSESRKALDAFGTGGPIVVGSQVVVKDHGMGTVEIVGCPTFPLPAYHVRIEGDAEAICFPAEHVTLYADVYAGIAPDPNAETVHDADTDPDMGADFSDEPTPANIATWEADAAAYRERDILGNSIEAIGEAERITTLLARTARAHGAERYNRAFGYTNRAAQAANEAEADMLALGERVSIARLRAAVILLAGITDETIRSVTNTDLDRLSDTLRRIENHEL